MKTSFALCSLLLAAASAFAGPESIIKQRAKELSNENNVRQGVPPPSQPQPPSAAQQATPPPPPPSITALQTDLAGFKAGTPATAEQKQKLANDIMAVAQGNKPSSSAATKLADSLASACAEKPLPAASRARLVQEIDAVLNPTKYPKANMDGIFGDVQAIFQENGVDRKKAVEISDAMKGLAGK